MLCSGAGVCSYPQHFDRIVDVVGVRVVEMQVWTELVEPSAVVAILQMDQQRSDRIIMVKK